VLKVKYNLCGSERMVFECLVHLEEQFTHDGGQGDFGRFAGQAQALVKLSQGGLGLARQSHGAHVKGAANDGAAAANVALAFPRATLSGPRSEARQGGGLLAIEVAQFGHLTEHAHGGERAHAVQLRQGVDLVLDARGAGQRGGEFFFHGGDLLFQVVDELGLLALGEAQGGVFAVLTGPHELFLELIAPLDERAQFGQVRIGDRCGGGFKRLAEGGQDGGIQRIIFGAPPLRQREVPNLGGIDDTDGQLGGVERGDHGAFVAPGGLADQVRAGDGAQESDQAGMTLGGVRQDVLAVLEVELEGGLGDVQAGIDGREVFSHIFNSVRTHSCTCEHAVKAAQSTVRVTDMRHEWLWLPDEHARAVPEGNERTRAAALPPAGGRAAPSSCLACSQTRKMKSNI
jgi:hypothetical protein